MTEHPLQSTDVLDLQFKAIASLFGNNAWVAWRIREQVVKQEVTREGFWRRRVVRNYPQMVERTIRPKMLATVRQTGVRTLTFDIPEEHEFDFTGILLGCHIFAKENGPWLLFAPWEGNTSYITPGSTVKMAQPITLSIPREYA